MSNLFDFDNDGVVSEEEDEEAFLLLMDDDDEEEENFIDFEAYDAAAEGDAR